MTKIEDIIQAVFTAGQEFQFQNKLSQRWADEKKSEACQKIAELVREAREKGTGELGRSSREYWEGYRKAKSEITAAFKEAGVEI
jgi:hypothetical protein